MDIKQIREEMEKANAYLKKCLWMDFEICQMDFLKIEVAGRVDTSSSEYAISIEFDQPYFVSGIFCWNLDNTKDFISIADANEQIEHIRKFKIEQGKYLFKINMEDFETPLYIAASGVKCNIYNTPFD
jgi:hypothetical protein